MDLADLAAGLDAQAQSSASDPNESMASEVRHLAGCTSVSNDASACAIVPYEGSAAQQVDLGELFVSKSVRFEGQFKKIAAGERVKTIMLTWAHTKLFVAPVSREDTIRRIGDAFTALKSKSARGVACHVDLTQCRIAVFEELHLSGEKHMHVIIDAPEKTRLLSGLAATLALTNVRVDARVFSSPSGRVPTLDRFLNYCLTPTESKWLVDSTPLLYNLTIPIGITDSATKALARLGKKPASIDDLYQFLLARPDITSPTDLDRCIDRETARKGIHANHHLPFLRLRLLISKSGKEFPADMQAQLDRIRNQHVNPDVPYASYFHDALSSACACPTPHLLERLLREGVDFHDTKEYYGANPVFDTSRDHLGSYYHHLVKDSFPSRQQSLVILGGSATGKSSVALQHLQVFPRKGRVNLYETFVFKPAMEDAFPFTGIPDLVKFADLNDFRTALKGFTPTTLLNLAEQAETKLAQKGGPPKTITCRLVISANYLKPAPGWTDVDIEALVGHQGRGYGGPIRWNHPLPRQQMTPRCRRCSAGFMQWCMGSPRLNIERACPPAPKRAKADTSLDEANISLDDDMDFWLNGEDE